MPEVAYPTSLKDLEARFATEAECRGYLWSLRWPDGFTCPSCGGGKGWPVREARLMECATCGHQTSLTAGTIFDNTKTPLRIWFRAALADDQLPRRRERCHPSGAAGLPELRDRLGVAAQVSSGNGSSRS